jgi:hypothetical protein
MASVMPFAAIILQMFAGKYFTKKSAASNRPFSEINLPTLVNSSHTRVPCGAGVEQFQKPAPLPALRGDKNPFRFFRKGLQFSDRS